MHGLMISILGEIPYHEDNFSPDCGYTRVSDYVDARWGKKNAERRVKEIRKVRNPQSTYPNEGNNTGHQERNNPANDVMHMNVIFEFPNSANRVSIRFAHSILSRALGKVRRNTPCGFPSCT